MPAYTVTANGILVYSGSLGQEANCVYRKHVEIGRLTCLYHCGIMQMCSDRVPAQNSRV